MNPRKHPSPPQQGTSTPAAALSHVILVGLQSPDDSPGELETSLRELRRLCESLGSTVTHVLEQRRAPANAAHLLGEGKVAELAALASDADAVVVDADITPSQQASLEQTLGCAVLDRTAIILHIFQRQARTREARLSVELARLAHETPRLRERAALADRGGGGGRGGKGNTGVELAKQRMRKRMAELREELDALAAQSATRQKQRREELAVALVGYTNSGKSSLMRALTGSDVLVEDRLFATLGTTVRVLQPDVAPRILVTDTVGFVRRLPHALLASFRTTLEEAAQADLMLLVLDASDPEHPLHLQVTRDTLAGVSPASPGWVVLNKVDRLSQQQRDVLAAQHPAAIQVSALDAGDVARLAQRVRTALEARCTTEETFNIPYTRAEVLARVHGTTTVLHTEFASEGTVVRVRGAPTHLARLRSMLG